MSFDELASDIDAVIERSKAAGVTSWITVGTDPQESQKAIELANKYDNMYATYGIHPHGAKSVTADAFIELLHLAFDKKVVAIGETGLDFHYNHSPPPDQKRIFRAHLQLAADMNLPVIIHSRDAFDETMEILDSYISLRGRPTKIVFHCFSGSPDQAKLVLDKGFYISFTGVVTFKNADKTRDTAIIVPLDRLMLETDCPYMSPEPMRKQKINEPALMINTAGFLAELKGMDLADFAKAVTAT
ncbi:MAG: TatD family hydrolase, partial [Planctomycetota bacterium]